LTAFSLAVAASGIALAGAATADEATGFARGDLARALRRFERAWDETRGSLTAEKLRRVAGHVSKATFAFFSSSTEPACAELARATAELRATKPSREALALHAVSALVPAGELDAGIVVARPSELVSRDATTLDVALVDSNEAVLERARVSIEAGKRSSEARLAHRMAPGVYEIRLLDGPVVVEARRIAVVADLDPRLRSLRDRASKLSGNSREATIHARLARLESARAGADDGVDRDLSTELEALEADVKALLAGEDPFPHRAGDELRAVVSKGVEILYRIAVPRSSAHAKSALVVALHGVGGDEDMFAEAYGRGIVKRLTLESGAIFVAPRSPGAFATGSGHALAVIDAVKRDYDVGSVFVLGHSMGAGQALDLVRHAPEGLKAAAFFSGPGGSTQRLDVPCFVATGSLDFARAGAKGFADAVMQSGGDVRYEERPGLEHLLVVRELAPAGFEFFRAHGLGPARHFY
jgi:poly(3-hydroxybutyrate) depolymerase